MSTATIVLNGPTPLLYPTVATAVDLYGQISLGDWSAAVRALAGSFTDPRGATEDLARLTARVRMSAIEERYTVSGTAQTVTYEGPQWLLSRAVDLYMRLHLGQFDQLAWVSGYGELSDALMRWRCTWQRPGAWPDHPRASWSIGNRDNVPDSARVAYDVWRLLGGGVQDRSLYGGITVEVSS